MGLSGTLIGYWNHDETGTGTRADSTANGLTLSNTNSATNGTGALNNATAFVEASSQYLTRASEALLVTGDIDFHFQTWVYADTFPGGGQWIAAKGEEWGVYITNGGTIQFWYDNFTKIINWSSGLSTDTWYNVVVWHDATANEVGIVVNDGTPVTSGYTSAGTTGTSAFTIGSRDGAFPVDGRMDESSFAKFVPSAADITLYYNGGTPPGYAALIATGGDVKTVNGLAIASVKTVNGLAIASVKTINGIATT